MNTWRDVRLKARERHEQISTVPGLTPAKILVRAGLKAAKLQVDRFQPGTVYAEGVLGALEREDGFVRLLSALSPQDEVIVIAHEIGHNWLHDESAFMIRSTEADFGGSPVEVGAERIVAYSPFQRLEVQADVFAQEFLLPADRLRAKLLAGRETLTDIAAAVGLPVDFVRVQAVRALLLPPLEAPLAPERVGSGPPPDPEQREAVEWDDRPLILDAGPGTGKTKTLVARVKHLLNSGTSPSSILALTFSNKAAAEMVERIEAVDPVAAPLIWVGTFHAFGLELLRLHHLHAGLPPKFDVLDETSAFAILENLLPDLDLRHYQNLWDPTLELRPILRAISRAKDEMVSQEEYALAAQNGRDRASTPEEVERAEKSLEIARVYTMYEAALHARKAVDFGDLVFKATKLLAAVPAVREDIRKRYQRVLVDEYQDVNFASTSLLEQVTDAGRNLWVVADPRQSIYRFRGAAPSNVEAFTSRYGAAERRRLKTNYRSCESVVRVFERYGEEMSAAPKPAARWKANRGRVGSVSLMHAPDLRSEAAAIRDRIERLRIDGTPYEQQAILARTHLCLARFGKLLQEMGVPVLYLGDLFERSEIRDLLALVSLGADRTHVGLMRVAGFPEYGATQDDALKVISAALDGEEDILVTCARAASIPGVSPKGAAGLILLAKHLSGMDWATTPWRMLTDYLLETSRYLLPLLKASDVASGQCLIAIYQLLKFAFEYKDGKGGRGGRRRFLDKIRRLERLDDERQFRVIPAEAEGLPAVRMMTIHASKGLEFSAVHLPQIATRAVPGPRRSSTCPAPLGLERLEVQAPEHAAEEQCLFFVALSRARDNLSVSSAKRYTLSQTCSPSKFLDNLGGVLGTSKAVTQAATPSQRVDGSTPPSLTQHEQRDLETYAKCPARYRYEVVEGLSGQAEKSPFLLFHGAVRHVLAWIERRMTTGTATTPGDAVAHLEGIWPDRGPAGSPFEKVYLAEAKRLVANAATAAIRGIPLERTWSVSVAGRTVTVKADSVMEQADGTILARRFKTGRRTKSEAGKPVWALLAAAAEATFPGREVRLEAFYPAISDGQAMQPKRDGSELDVYIRAIQGIEQGLFPPETGRDCPSCHFYFICTAEDSF